MLAWDDGLTGPARRIAEIDHSPFRVLAGPGTGKTFALKRRVARLLQAGHDARRLFVCTFTRTAANDLKNEVVGLGVEGVDAVRACTLHSYCFELLAKASVLELTGRVPRPLLSFEERFLLQDMCGNSLGGVRECDKRLKAFNAAWARLQNEEPGWCSEPVDRAFDQSLKSWLRFHQAMLIGELIPEALRYLRNNPLCAERQEFDHVLVDEYQDLNRAEQVLLDNVADGHNLQVIGDEDQSIYSFKYAHPEGVSEFDATHPNTHDETLEICRRCPTSVVEMANRLISHNAQRQDRILQPLAGNSNGDVHVVQWDSMDDEADGVAMYVKEKIVEDGIAPGRVLVLSPRRQFGYAVRDALNAISTPAHSFFNEEAVEGNVKKLDESQAAQAFTLLTLLANPDDRVALRCWCGFGSDSLNKGAWDKLRAYSCETGIAPRAILEALTMGQIAIPHTKPIVARYQELKLRLQALQGLRGVSLVEELFPAATDWSEPLRTLAPSLPEEELDAATLLDSMRTGITQPEMPTDVDYVRVMSLHKSKGLTADLVVILGCIEGAIPRVDDGIPQAEYQRAYEEQRRLFYVAITRTRKTLVLSSVTKLPTKLAYQMGVRVAQTKWRDAMTITSSFISELGPNCPKAVSGSRFLQGQGLQV